MAKKGSKNADGVERRRHPRINIQNELHGAKAIVGATAHWGAGQSSQVFDMSYSGIAVARPEGLELEGLKETNIKLELGSFEEISVQTKVAWLGEKVVGLQFSKIDSESRLTIDDFLEDQLIGAHLIQVSPKYFSQSVDFDHWYHGPNNTNVFLWLKHSKDQIEKAVVSFDTQSMIFEGGQFHSGGAGVEWEVQATYSAETLPSKKRDEDDLLVLLESEAPLVRRSIEVLSQVQEKASPLKTLVEAMVEACR